MKKYLLSFIVVVLAISANGQSVAINTDGSTVSDPKAMLEVKKPVYSKVKIRSTSLIDTAVLELSNRTPSSLGTDFLFSLERENGLVLKSRSDVPSQNTDSIITFSPQGLVALKSLRGTGTRSLLATASGQLIASGATQYLSIPGAGFQPKTAGAASNFNAMDASGLLSFTPGTFSYVVAPVLLPDGATVTSFKVYFVDNSATDLFFILYSTGVTSFTNSMMVTLTSSGASGSSTTMSSLSSTIISTPVIDNSSTLYYINAGPAASAVWDANLRIKAVVIGYTL
ncbi:MAG: hypothetical protein ABJA78_10305 [Ferruginibacter sp.]